MSAPTDSKPSFLKKLVTRGREVFHLRRSSHRASAAAKSNAKTALNPTPDAPPPIPSPPSTVSPTVWHQPAPPFTPLRAARPASPVLTFSPLTLSSLASSSSTLGDLFGRYPDPDSTLVTPSSSRNDGILFKNGLDDAVKSGFNTHQPSPSSSARRLSSSSPHSDDDGDGLEMTYDSEVQLRSPPRHSRSPSPTSSMRGLAPSSPRRPDDDDDDKMDVAVPEVPSEQDALAADEDMLDLAPAPAALAAELTSALLEHPLADQDNARDFFLVINSPSPLASTTNSTTPSRAFNPSDGLGPAAFASVPSPALPAPASTFAAQAPAPSASRASRPSRPHLPLPAPVIGKRAHHDSDDEERVMKKMKAPRTPSATQPATQPVTQKPTKMERRAAFHVSKSAAAARAIHLADDVALATEYMEVDDGAVAAPDTFDRDWTSGTPIANVAPAAIAAFFQRTTEISRIVVDWEDSLCVSVRTQSNGKGKFNQCVPDVLRHLNTMTTVLVLGDTVPDQHLDALEAATELDAEVLIIRVSGNDDAPLWKRRSTLLALRSLRQVFFLSVGCDDGRRHSIPWENAHHLMDVVIRTERKPDVDHKDIFIVDAGNHRDELRNVGFSV